MKIANLPLEIWDRLNELLTLVDERFTLSDVDLQKTVATYYETKFAPEIKRHKYC